MSSMTSHQYEVADPSAAQEAQSSSEKLTVYAFPIVIVLCAIAAFMSPSAGSS